MPELGVGLGQEFFGSLRVTAKIIMIVVLSSVDLLVGLNDVALGCGEIAVAMRVDVDDRRLGGCYSKTGKAAVENSANDMAFPGHD